MTTTIELSPPIPILRMFDVAKTREFYLDFLGFSLDWEHRFQPDLPLYMQVSRSGATLHLSEHFGDGSPGASVFLPMEGVEALQAELIAKAYRHAWPGVEKAPWGLEMTISDPSGNRIRFCERRGQHET
jgi:catechol 2,3-dioxygenase-like lactoylglutathione lyase family enzyme